MRNNTGQKINFATVCRTPSNSPQTRIAQGLKLDADQLFDRVRAFSLTAIDLGQKRTLV
jgi:hypothetical protein